MHTPCAQKVGHCVLIVIFNLSFKNEFKTRRQPVRLKATETKTETDFFSLRKTHFYINS